MSLCCLSDEAENAVLQPGSVCAADVVLYGLNIIVPLMTAELLKVNFFFINYSTTLFVKYHCAFIDG